MTAALFAPFLLAVLVSPIVEELLLRGGLERWLVPRWGWARSTAVVAVAFALAHGQFSVAAVALALAGSGLHWRFRSLMAPIGLHAAANLAVWVWYT